MIFLLILPLCSIYRHGGHDGWSAGSSDITFKGNPPKDDSGQVWFKLAQWFQRRSFEKSLQTHDGRQVMAIAHTCGLKMNYHTLLFTDSKCTLYTLYSKVLQSKINNYLKLKKI